MTHDQEFAETIRHFAAETSLPEGAGPDVSTVGLLQQQFSVNGGRDVS